MRSDPSLKTIPRIMLISRTDHDIIDEIHALGVRGALMKPFNEAALLEKIQSVIKLKPAKM